MSKVSLLKLIGVILFSVFKPILLEDYTYEECPESLVNLLKSIRFSDIPVTRIQTVVGLIHLLMLESGFVPPSYHGPNVSLCFNYARLQNLSKSTISLLKPNKDGNYSLKYILQNYEEFEVKVVIINFCDDLLVNCTVKGLKDKPLSVLLDPLKYFISSNTDLFIAKFQQLKHLSKVFKDRIAFPIKLSILTHTGGTLIPCLESMPNEILLMIIGKLYHKEKHNLMLVNRKFYQLLC